jgi:hypothetical protein
MYPLRWEGFFPELSIVKKNNLMSLLYTISKNKKYLRGLAFNRKIDNFFIEYSSKVFFYELNENREKLIYILSAFKQDIDSNNILDDIVGEHIIITRDCFDNLSIRPDACAFLPVIYSKKYNFISEKVLCGVSNCAEYSKINFEAESYFPFGHTVDSDFSRLLPNHELSLSSWTVERYRFVTPLKYTDYSISSRIDEIIDLMTSHFHKACSIAPLSAGFTGGYDSRAIVAILQFLDVPFESYTLISDDDSNSDSTIARKIAQKLNINHISIRFKMPDQDEILKWHLQSGYAVSGRISNIFHAHERICEGRWSIIGIAGEVGLKEYDFSSPPNKDDLLKIYSPNISCDFSNAASAWMSDFTEASLDELSLHYFIENRLACWGAGHFSTTNKCHAFTDPFNNYKIFSIIMSFTKEQRADRTIHREIVNRLTPIIKDIPYSPLKLRVKNFVKNILNYYAR